jgi:hypothetical protein
VRPSLSVLVATQNNFLLKWLDRITKSTMRYDFANDAHKRLGSGLRSTTDTDAIGQAFRLLFNSGVSDYNVEYEAFLDDLEYARKETAPRDERLRCDVVLERGFTGHRFVTDVSITHPDHTQSATRTEMLCSATKSASGKVAQYVSVYEIDQEDVVPEIYGGYPGHV